MYRSARILLLSGLLVCVAALISAAQTKPSAKPQGAATASQHTIVTPDQIKWGPAPPALPAGAQMAVLSGDPSKPGSFTIRAKFPDGYAVAPHWHPTDEHLVVIAGTFMLGVGDKADASSAHAMPVGTFAKMPRGVHHYARAKGETIIQVYGMGPFVVNYVNPSDDPRKKTTEATK
jgi:hypothetical protein